MAKLLRGQSSHEGLEVQIRPLRQFSQHFLTDADLADRIVQAAQITSHEPVWEIGPGKGILTDRLLRLTDKLTAFEIDTRLAKLLSEQYKGRLNLLVRDILAVNWRQLLVETSGNQKESVKLVSNLPYQITSPVLYELEQNAEWFSRIVMMIQQEVAERLTATAGSKAYGVLTLKLRYVFETELLFNVPPEAFSPAPQVHSSVVLLKPRRQKPAIKSLDIYRKIIQTAFAHRRKTLRNNLRSLYAPELLTALEVKSGIDFNRRGETIEEAEYIHLADCAFDLARP